MEKGSLKKRKRDALWGGFDIGVVLAGLVLLFGYMQDGDGYGVILSILIVVLLSASSAGYLFDAFSREDD